ncbi:hypothetical protein HYZ06_02490 [Candidatus Daviesbacteria bacterium]|nr:hypothetical protein [Candidatus Daviesbacteria bacterium]
MDRLAEMRRGVSQGLERVRVGVSNFLDNERRAALSITNNTAEDICKMLTGLMR